MEPAAATDHLTLQHRQHVRGLHLQPAQTAGRAGQREDEAGGRAEEHAGPGRRLQEQVRLDDGVTFYRINPQKYIFSFFLMARECAC